jgi:beta-phosphoglucomutase family hydrolase
MKDAMQPLSSWGAVLFDLDGVLTPTALIHQRAWQEIVNTFLGTHYPSQPPFTHHDYHQYVDGRPRQDGLDAFFSGRNLSVEPHEVSALAEHKQQRLVHLLDEGGVAPYVGSLALVQQLADVGCLMGVVSSSANAPRVLAAAQLTKFFAVVVDGAVAAAHQLPGKPAPDTWIFAARQLGLAPGHCVVVEDAVAGVRSGVAGNFGLVIGVDRGTGAEALTAAGAHLVVSDLSELVK